MTTSLSQAAAQALQKAAVEHSGDGNPHAPIVIYPPADVKSVIDKTAGFVAKHGAAFEARVQAQQAQEAKFAFLKPDNPYRRYYDNKVQELRGGKADTGPVIPKALLEYRAQQSERLRKRSELKALADGEIREYPAPAPDNFTVEHPFIAPADMDIIKLCAQFTAQNGSKFMSGISARESRNPQFDFLKPTHPLFQYFTSLVDSYTRTLKPTSEDREMLSSYEMTRYAILDRITARFQWQQQEHRRKQDSEKAQKEEREQRQLVDWHAFTVVETIDFAKDDLEVPLPPPIIPTLGRRPETGTPLSLKEAAALNVIQKKTTAPDPIPADRPVPIVSLVNVDTSLEGKTNVEADTTEKHTPLVEDAAEESVPSEPPEPVAVVEKIDELPLPDLDGGVQIRTDYQPGKARLSARTAEETRICPITGQRVPESQFSEHIRVVLMDPKWKEQKDKVESRAREDSNYDTANLNVNLADFITKRPDLFGSVEQEIRHQATVALEHSIQEASYDAGPQAGNVAAAANQLPAGAVATAPGDLLGGRRMPAIPPDPKKTKHK